VSPSRWIRELGEAYRCALPLVVPQEVNGDRVSRSWGGEFSATRARRATRAALAPLGALGVGWASEGLGRAGRSMLCRSFAVIERGLVAGLASEEANRIFQQFSVHSSRRPSPTSDAVRRMASLLVIQSDVQAANTAWPAVARLTRGRTLGIRNDIARELIPWALRYGDPVWSRVTKRGVVELKPDGPVK
jgi:hypothetical protein